MARPIDVLTGDYLAELTMLILWKAQQRDPDAGYARTFLTQMEDVLGTCLDRGVKIVTNAGGLNPRALADRLRELGERLGATPRIAVVEGDDILDRIPELQQHGLRFEHLDRGVSLADAGVKPVTANAYLGGWGRAALDGGADVVVCEAAASAPPVSRAHRS
jgi:NAD(P)H-dependent flavin oxidoreductase YrpB (nitropropane dioxygenase family)